MMSAHARLPFEHRFHSSRAHRCCTRTRTHTIPLHCISLWYVNSTCRIFLLPFSLRNSCTILVQACSKSHSTSLRYTGYDVTNIFVVICAGHAVTATRVYLLIILARSVSIQRVHVRGGMPRALHEASPTRCGDGSALAGLARIISARSSGTLFWFPLSRRWLNSRFFFDS
jgi:hypothetical protein